MSSGYKSSNGTDLINIFQAQNYVTDYFYNNVVSNPYFNIPSISTNSYSYVSSLSTITNWTFSGTTSGTLITNGINPWNNTNLPWSIQTPPWTACTQALSIQFNGLTNPTYTVSQSLTLTAGTYIVSFYARPRQAPNYNVLHKLTGSLNGSSATTEFTTTSGWIQYIFVSTITTTGTYPLSFVFSHTGTTSDTSISLTGITVTLNTVISPAITNTNFKIGGTDLKTIFLTIPVSNSQIYLTNTGFKNSSGLDLKSIFQWGGYTTTASYSNTSSTFNTISFTVSGTYKYVIVNTDFYTASSFTYTSSGLTPGTGYIYNITPYNGFNTAGTTITTSVLTTASLIAPVISLTSINGVSTSSYTLTFAYSGGSYVGCNVRLYNSANIYLSTLGYISYSNSGTFTTGTMTTTEFYIKFITSDINGNEGPASNVINKTMAAPNNYSYTTVQTNTAFSLPTFTFDVSYILIGGGGSGGSGGANGDGTQPNGGGGGGGGRGTIVNGSFTLIGSSSIQQTGVLTVGAGGAGVDGVLANNGGQKNSNGNDGNDGNDSTLNFYNIITYTANKGIKGLGGKGYPDGGNNNLGGAGGSIDGGNGISNGGAGGSGGSTGNVYGNGSAGSGGVGRATSGTTLPAQSGKCVFTAYYFT